MTNHNIDHCVNEVVLKWIEMDQEWPPDPEKVYLFYNRILDIYAVTTLNDIEKHFKIYRHELKDSMDVLDTADEVDRQVAFWISHRFDYTHWSELKPPNSNTL